MKKGLILTASLAMVLGVGVAVGAHRAESVKEVKAATNSVTLAGSFNSWSTTDTPLTLDGDYWTISREFSADDQFKVVVNGTDWVGDGDGVTWCSGMGSEGKGQNFKVLTDGTYLIKAAKTIGDYGDKSYGIIFENVVEPDVPESDGYYLVGSKSDWKYAGAPKLNAGTDGNDAQLLGYYASDGESFKVRRYNSEAEAEYKDVWYGWGEQHDQNYVVTGDQKLDIYINEDHHLWVNVIPDVPSEDGYYVCGEFSSTPSWRYEYASKMTQTEGENVAYLMNFSCAKGDELRIRSYFSDREAKDQWAEVGNVGEYAVDFGEKSGNNFKFTAEGINYYDLYAKYENDVFKFYIAEHGTSYEVEMTAVLFAGKDKTGTATLLKQVAYPDKNFEPIKPSRSGYETMGVYTNEACTPGYEYEPTKLNAPGHLYVKYMKYSAYLTGDDTFLGEGHGWKVAYSTEVGPQGDNKYVGTVVVPEGVTDEKTMSVKVLEYVDISGTGGWGAIYYTMGHEEGKEPDFVTIDGESNFVFNTPGTYAFYINNEDKVWFNGGEYAFHARFITEVAAVCSSSAEGRLDALKAKWLEMETAYDKLSPEEKAIIVSKTIDGGDEHSSDDRLRMIAKYSYCVHRYGTSNLKDFIFGGSYSASADYMPSFNASDNSAITIIITVASITMVSTGLLLFLKKRKMK